MNIYFVHNYPARRVKIGCTTQLPEHRCTAIAALRKERLNVISSFETDARDAERAIHYHFREFLIPELGREWFRIGKAEALAFTRYWNEGVSQKVLSTYRKTRKPGLEERLEYIGRLAQLKFFAAISGMAPRLFEKKLAQLKAKFGIGKWLGRKTA